MDSLHRIAEDAQARVADLPQQTHRLVLVNAGILVFVQNDILGDYGRPGKDIMAYRRLFRSLRGKKVLIIGNHDVRKDGSLDPEIERLPWHIPPRDLLEVKDGGRRVILCHYALRTWPASHYGSVHFYGHSHGRLPGVGLSRDVGVDMPDVAFTPRTFAELTKGWVWPSVDPTEGEGGEL